ncbi:DNA-directed RNA polymerase subunit alpha, partial [Methylobacterium radiotolerans]
MPSGNLTEAGKLEMQIKVEKGRGYVPGNVRALSEDRTHT